MKSSFVMLVVASVGADECEIDAMSVLQGSARAGVEMHRQEVCRSVEVGQKAPIDGVFTANDGSKVTYRATRGEVAQSAGRFCVDEPTVALLQRAFSVSDVSDFDVLVQKKQTTTEESSTEATVSGKSGTNTTAAPANTTAAPANTTAAPANTTAAPANTTAAPANTTAAPANTTAAPANTTAAPAMGIECAEGIWCQEVQASGLTFNCRFGWPEGAAQGNVIMLHGFPEWADMYDGTMRALADGGYASVACDQRGYSPNAPNDTASYHYDELRDDVFAVGSAVGFEQFHIVSHDHGGLIGWVVAGTGSSRVLSLTSLSTPHVDALSSALIGPEADLQQQCASQYFTMFMENNSARSHNNFWCNFFETDRMDCDTLQRGFYWYNGASDAGYMAIPPTFNASYMASQGGYCASSAVIRAAWGPGSGELPQDGQNQTKAVGMIHVPTLFVCGATDSSILCNRPYALSTETYCDAGYTYLEVDCGHDLLSCGQQTETDKVIAAIVAHIAESSES